MDGLAYASQGVCPPPHIDESVRVSYVYDGDTLKLEDGRKIRLIGIDTPEVFSKKRAIASDVKDSGERARAALQQQLKLSKNHIGLAYGAQRFDRYGRTLAHIFLPDGKNLQAWLITRGHAIAFTTPPNDQLSDCYRQQEKLAQQSKKDIWQMSQYQIKQGYQLSKRSKGFHRLRGKVSRVINKPHQITLLIDGRVEVYIDKSDLHYFNSYQLNSLKGKVVIIRGWLHRKKINKAQVDARQSRIDYAMRLRHADSLRVDKVIH